MAYEERPPRGLLLLGGVLGWCALALVVGCMTWPHSHDPAPSSPSVGDPTHLSYWWGSSAVPIAGVIWWLIKQKHPAVTPPTTET